MGSAAGRDHIWPTKLGDAAKADKTDTAGTRQGHGGRKADTWRTHGAQVPGTRPEHIAASLFILRENPTVNCLGNYTSIDPKQFLKHRVRLQRPNLGNRNERPEN